MHRPVPGFDESEGDLTILVESQWTGDHNGQEWYSAAGAIRDELATNILTRNIKVEILSWQLTKPRTIDIVEKEYPLVSLWPNIDAQIHIIIKDSPKVNDGWLTIDVLRIGYISEVMSPKPVTVSITVDWSLDRRDWIIAEQEMKALLQRHNLHKVNVEFERGDNDQLAVFPIQPPRNFNQASHDFFSEDEDYPRRANLGCGFGPEKYFTMGPDGVRINGPQASFGGYVEVRRKDKGSEDNKFRKYGVTNYHCVREAIPGFSYNEGTNGEPIEASVPAKSVLWNIDRNGMGPDMETERAQITAFESPSRRKHNFSLHYHDGKLNTLQERIIRHFDDFHAQDQIEKHEASRRQKIEYFNQGKQHLGELWMASGFKQHTKENGRIDIALLEIDREKMGSNLVPDRSTWTLKRLSAPEAACGKILKGLKPCSERTALGEVFKVGSRAGGTTGRFNSIESDMNYGVSGEASGLKESKENCFVADSASRPFLDYGDSGSFVFTYDGEWVGVVRGGSSKQNLQGKVLGAVTDAQEIIDWIEKQGDGNTYEARLATY